MRWSNHGDEAEEKQRSSDEEEREEMQSRGDLDVAVHKQPRADEDKGSPGLNHPGQNKKERPKRNDHNRRRKETRHPPDRSIQGRNKQQGPPSPGQDRPRTSGGQTPRTGSSGVGLAAGTAAPLTGASRDQRRWTPPGLEHPRRNKQQVRQGAQQWPQGRGGGDAAKQSGGQGRGQAERTR